MGNDLEAPAAESRARGALSELRPYRRRLIILVVLAAIAGVAVGELAPAGPASSTKSTAISHHRPVSHGRDRR
jgi:hypothetical protein